MEGQLAAMQAEIVRMQGEVTQTRQDLQQATAQRGQPPPPAAQAFSPLIDTRMLTKPCSFSGREEDWSSFATVTRAYCGALDRRLLGEMEEAAAEAAAVFNDNMEEGKKHRSQTLFYLLVMLVEGRALSIAENCKTGEGLELWRKLVSTYEPKAGTRAASLLVKILTVDFDMTDFLNSVEKWEY